MARSDNASSVKAEQGNVVDEACLRHMKRYYLSGEAAPLISTSTILAKRESFMPERSDGASYWREATMLHLSRRSVVSYEAARARHEAFLSLARSACQAAKNMKRSLDRLHS